MFTFLYFLSYLVSLVIMVALFVLLFSVKERQKDVTFLMYTMIPVILWTFLEFLAVFFINSELMSVVLWKFIYVSRILATLLFTYFIIAFTKRVFKKSFLYLLSIPLLVSAIVTLFTSISVVGIEQAIYGGSTAILGDLSVYVSFIRPIYLILAIYFLVSAYIKEKSNIVLKKQITYLSIGTLLVAAAAVFTSFIFPIVGIYDINFVHIPVTLLLIFIFYIIFKYSALGFDFIKFRIRHKVLLAILISSIIPIGIIYSLNAPSYNNVLLEKTLSESGQSALNHKILIESKFKRYKDDVLFISKIPQLNGLIRSRETGVDNITGLSRSALKTQVKDIFVALSQSANLYIQIRYINENGNEVIRINSENSIVDIVDDDLLQNKIDRYYFKESVVLDKGKIYTSPFDLNRENGEMEVPYKPVIRYATPVYQNFINKGIVIINVSDTSLFDIFVSESVDNEKHILLDSEGFYLVHTDKEKEWGNDRDFGTGENLKKDYPDLSKEILSGKRNSFLYNDEVLIFEPVFLGVRETDKYLIILEIINRDVLLAPLDKLKNLTIISIIIALFVVIVFSYIASLIITRPINKLHENVISVRRQGGTNILINTRDEVGELSKEFSDLFVSEKEARDNIEGKVEEQIKSIENQKIKIEEQRLAVLNILDDVSKEKEIASLERDKLQTTLKSIGDGVFVVDNNYKITLFNLMSEEISGYTSGEVIGKRYDDVLKFKNEKTGEKTEEFIINAVEQGISDEMANHTLLERKDGTFVSVADSASPIKNIAGKSVGAIVVFRDVTQEDAIDKAKSEFVSTASHQLRTPLVGIRWVIERFIKEEKLTESGRGYLNDIEKSMIRLMELVDALLNVSRIESAGGISIIPEPIELISYVSDFIDENRPLLDKKQLRFIYENKPEKLNVLTDGSAIGNILQSLVSNAIEYTSEKGEIEISINEKGDRFILTIRDTGIGIPKDEQETIFDKFSRATNAKLVKTDGTGLGLYIAKEAATALGGKIWFESEENKGTIFYVDLPLESMEKKSGKKFT